MPVQKIRFYISGLEKEVSSDASHWKLPLITKSNLSSSSSSRKTPLSGKEVITVGDYLSAAEQFLRSNDFAILKKGFAGLGYKPVSASKIQNLDLFLEKHGAFYHPVKVVAGCSDNGIGHFVLNGAISDQGLYLLEKEYAQITFLNKKHSQGFLPQVYGCRFLDTDKGRIGFFFGEWFEGFKEFHVTEDRGHRQVVIWDSDGTCSYIDPQESFEIYRQIARILTSYYNPETFEQIFPWHHAAGDFIIRESGRSYSVRLITARGYQNLTDIDGTQPDGRVMILPALLIFFLNLTLRIRLDRLNGTGDAVLVEDGVIPFVIDGFFKGLDDLSSRFDFGSIQVAFLDFSREFTSGQLIEIAHNVFESYPVAASERSLIQQDLVSHLEKVFALLKTL